MLKILVPESYLHQNIFLLFDWSVV